MPTENQRAMRRAFAKNQPANPDDHAKQFGMTQDELSVEIDGHKARPKAVVKKDKASLYQGNESIYDSYHEALSKKFHRDLLAEFQNSPLAVCELFDTGRGNESIRTRERSVDRRSLRLSVMGGSARKDLKNQADSEPLTPSKAGGSTAGGSIRERATSKSSADSDHFSADDEASGAADRKISASGQKDVRSGKPADKTNKPKRDPRRLIPIKVEDRGQVPSNSSKTQADSQKLAARSKAAASRHIEEAEQAREQRRREMNAKRDEKIRKLRGEKEFGIETDAKLKDQIQKDVQKEMHGGKRLKPVIKEGIRVKQHEDELDPDGGLEIPAIVFREIDSDEEERIAHNKFARMNRDEEDEESRRSVERRNEQGATHTDDSDDSAPKPLGRRNQATRQTGRSASKGSRESESVEYSRSSMKNSARYYQQNQSGRDLSYNEDAIDGEVYDEDEDPDLAGVTDKRQREEIIAYKLKLIEAAEEEDKLDEYRSIVRRVCALRSYKFDPSAPIKPREGQKTDITRVSKANFRYQEDQEMEAALDKHEFATVKQIENEALFEVLWRGSITTLGKKQAFFVENLIPCAGFFRGCMVYDDSFLILKGDYDHNTDPNTHLPFSLEAYEETALRYRLKGKFVKYDIEMTMEQIGSEVSIPMTLQISFKSVPCTVYSEPYKTILPGRCKISHVLLVVFYNNDTLNVFCGKRNKQGVFVARHMKDGQLQENIILRQTKNPRKVNSSQALTLLDEKSMIGYVVEVHNV